ncbi:MAG: glutamate--tRNA ligase [Syntrophaceae bacterium]|nr:glutamate--tRNA ligase [Syntrophaceae bacterium]
MKDKKTRVRFAPSPSGELHIGNARTALFNWLFARHRNGTFVLRVEDTDEARSDIVFQNNLYEDLKWLGLDWDEGPVKNGAYGPYRQSERLDIYKRHLISLMEKNLVYPCYCAQEELEEERQNLILSKRMPRYMGKCRNLTDAEKNKKKNEGRVPSFRFKIEPQVIEFEDIIRGTVRFESEAIGDFIIMRSNGMPAYNFAVVIDDHLMDITHVIRGEDHLSNTALQLLLYRAFGYNPPVFAHHSLIFGKDRTKLSKRHGSVSVGEFRKKGILPEALLNYLGILGTSYPNAQELLSREELIKHFSIERASKSGAVFDEDKLLWLNAIYIRNTETRDLLLKLLPFIESAGYDISGVDEKWLIEIIDLVKTDLVILSDIGNHLDIFLDDKYKLTNEAKEIIKNDENSNVVRLFMEYLKNNNAEAGMLYSDALKYVKRQTNKKGKDLFMPIRAALTGKTTGPQLDKIFSILGKDAALKRLNNYFLQTTA